MNHYVILKMSKDLKKLSKFLAVILRHNPDDFGITLDEQGFTPLEPVWNTIQQKYGNRFDYADLEIVVAGDRNGKKRYEIKDDLIRAMYGHSQIRDITYVPAEPPEFLFHGTNAKAVEAIREEGLTAQNRQYVHLTTNISNATNVAHRRTDNAILLKIRAKEAHDDGLVFHHAEREHYLCRQIPPKYIDFPND
jgi:putative RNA 2'-phosphotransferase